MQTLLTTSPERAAAIVKAGGLVAFPTETVYGLGADATNPDAIRRVFEAKQRPPDNPLIVHLASVVQIDLAARSVSSAAQAIIAAFFPGPITVILPRGRRITDAVSAGLDTVAVRVPSLAVTRSFLQMCGVPVAAPSANLSGRPSPTTWEAALQDLDGRIDGILQGPRATHGLESTVVDCVTDPPLVLRSGAISLEALQEVVPGIQVATDDAGLMQRSPGTRHRHYAPRALVRVVSSPDDLPSASDRAGYIGIDRPADNRLPLHHFIAPSTEAYAHALYDFFRNCDQVGVAVIYCQAVPEPGLGRALMDRLRRAEAAHRSDVNPA